MLFRPGDACTGFVMLGTGTVRVEPVAEDGHALLLYRVAPGEACLLTTACLFAGEAYTAEGRAETPVEGLSLPRAAFDAPIAESPAFRRFVLAGFGARMTAMMARIEALSFRSVDRRLAEALLAHGGREVAATQAELVVALGRGTVAILNPAGLRARAEGG